MAKQDQNDKSTRQGKQAQVGREKGVPGSIGSDPVEHAGGPGTPGVYPASANDIPGDAVAEPMNEMGQGKRGAKGYQDSGESGLETSPIEDGLDENEGTEKQARKS